KLYRKRIYRWDVIKEAHQDFNAFIDDVFNIIKETRISVKDEYFEMSAIEYKDHITEHTNYNTMRL
ncbi:8604_t:CDS:2, partial [Entrophospora sp. SA101]